MFLREKLEKSGIRYFFLFFFALKKKVKQLKKPRDKRRKNNPQHFLIFCFDDTMEECYFALERLSDFFA